MTSYLALLFNRSARRKSISALQHMDDHLLADIGLTRNDVHQMMRGRAAPSRGPSGRE